MVLGLWLAIVSPAVAGVEAPALQSVHAGRDATWRWQSAADACCTAYDWVADRPSTSSARRWHLAKVWWARAANAHAYYEWWQSQQPASGVPAWFAADLECIGLYEEGGQNSVAGLYGFVYAPSSYGGIAATLAQTYGESWLNWPKSAQQEVAWMLYGEYGWSPWSTAAVCGL